MYLEIIIAIFAILLAQTADKLAGTAAEQTHMTTATCCWLVKS